MKFTFENFGYIDKGEVELADLTLICGPNNVGKTYISYAIYGFLKHFISLIYENLNKESIASLDEKSILKIDVKNFSERLTKKLPESGLNFIKIIEKLFNSPEGFFDNANIDFSLGDFQANLDFSFQYKLQDQDGLTFFFEKPKGDNFVYILLDEENHNIDFSEINFPVKVVISTTYMKIINQLFSHIYLDPFIATSERTSIPIFYKEIDANRNSLLGSIYLNNTQAILQDALLDSSYSRYSEPIKDNINTIRNYGNIIKHKSFLSKDKDKYQAIFDMLEEIIGGSFENKSNQVIYRTKKEKDRKEVNLPIYLASSSTKSLFLIDLYINCLAKKNGLLVIDEPELNLHPDNQRKMAGLLARLVNSGIKVLITTHSDYLVREINNRIMLSNDIKHKEKIMQDNHLLKADILKPKQVAAYLLDSSHTINKVKVDKLGMDMNLFDDIIDKSNNLGDEIYYNIEG